MPSGAAGSSSSFLRQLSGREGWNNNSYSGSNSKRWSKKQGGYGEMGLQQLDGMSKGESGMVTKKRVMVVIDHSARAKHAMMWALTHVANRGDILTLLHVIPPHTAQSSSDSSPQLANSLGTLCKACKPEVEVEALVIQGPKLATVLSQVKKLEARVLVLGQNKSSSLCCLFGSSSREEEFVEQCINRAECLTMAVRKQGGGVGGYSISTRWRKNFWLLA